MGHHITVPKEIFNLYIETPSHLLTKMANIVNSERILEIGYVDEEYHVQKETISSSEKHIFASVDD